MEKEFVKYEQALALKELGFDEPCFGSWETKYVKVPTYTHSISEFYKNSNHPVGKFTAPTYSAAFRWFRQNYGLYHNIWNLTHGEPTDLIPNGFAFSIDEYWITIIGKNELGYFKKYYETYEEAESACLIKLIEICKTKINE